MKFTFVCIAISLVSISFSLHSRDRQEGWIVKETEQGLLKVPKKQYFSFDGYDVDGDPYVPSQGVLDKRALRKRRSLIPERRSYKREVLESSGYRTGR